jgi:hypothetical protein
MSPYRHEVGEAKLIGCQYVVINANFKNWVWSKRVGSAGRGTCDELCERVTELPSGAASGFAGEELERESWTG